MTEKKDNNEEKKIDSNAIVSPKNTEKLYGKINEKEPVAGQSEEINTELPEDIDGVEENMFPSA